MAILTTEQKKNYLKKGGGVCPFCGDQDISGDSIEIDGTVAWQNVSCAKCKENWRDVYTLEYVETDDEFKDSK